MRRLVPTLIGVIFIFAVFSGCSGDAADDQFESGILGIAWGDMKERIQYCFPSGSWINFSDGRSGYRLRDGRSFLSIDRDADNEIRFRISKDGRVEAASITFPLERYEALIAELTKRFGEPVSSRTTEPQSSFSNRVSWPDQKGVRITLVATAGGLFPDTLALIIERLAEPGA